MKCFLSTLVHFSYLLVICKQGSVTVVYVDLGALLLPCLQALAASSWSILVSLTVLIVHIMLFVAASAINILLDVAASVRRPCLGTWLLWPQLATSSTLLN